MTVTAPARVADHHDPRVREWRHHLHQHPETAFDEHLTSAYVAAVLRQLGFEVVTGIGGTGVVGSLTRGTSGRVIGLRAELDALPIAEETGRSYSSQNSGAMHACGHDGHMAMVLGAAAFLAEQGGFDGTVRTVFQPAEEPGRGAQAMIDDGLLDQFPMDAIYALHNHAGAPQGQLLTRSGPIMASEDNFSILITGRGGHASAPHLVIDPLVVAAETVLALQQVVARSIDPVHTAVLSCTDLQTDGARNAIPTTVRITGDTRSFEPAVQQLLEKRIREISEGVAAAHGAEAVVTYTHEFRPTVNDTDCVATALAAARTAFGDEMVDADAPRVMASEDFGVLARHLPACFALLGNGTSPDSGGIPLHSKGYDFNDEVLRLGVAYFVQVVRDSLPMSEG